MPARRNGEEEAGYLDEEEEHGGAVACRNNLTIDMAGTEEDTAEKLQEKL